MNKITFKSFDKREFDERSKQGLCPICCDVIVKEETLISEPYGDKYYTIHARHINYERK